MTRYSVSSTNENDLLSQITRPTLLLDETRCRRNIQRMADKARANHVRFRPHFKTHQSAQIGAWFREYGVEVITVSSVEVVRFYRPNPRLPPNCDAISRYTWLIVAGSPPK